MFEKELQKWEAIRKVNGETSIWKDLQLMFMPEVEQELYAKPTLTGKQGKVKTCQCCKASKDGQGINKGYLKYVCRDQSGTDCLSVATG
ncbi:hypothetical protein M422DRAFT_256313 [Sphaerobolus stellatus SS14]|uniref:Uncharacterized protein n=1 Tax=Sphaerobolus stellatus (strain SS14) TaxID=990650 RepID=A0A0C9VGS1_SPHS4|nr:hypothetical protein M422DRAFT_256313 [Sphaerobolus stellatus SS14]